MAVKNKDINLGEEIFHQSVLTDLFENFISFLCKFKVLEGSLIFTNEVCSFFMLLQYLIPSGQYNHPVLYGGGNGGEIKQGNCYKTFGDVYAAVKTCFENNFHPMTIRHSKVFDYDSEDYYYQFLSYLCIHHGKFISKSKGVRPKQRSNHLGCPACVHIRLNFRPRPHYRISKVNLEHNHNINSKLYGLYPKQRLLNLEEREFLKDALTCDAIKTKDIRQFIERNFGKSIYSTDVRNLRSWHKSNFGIHDCSKHEAHSLDVLTEKWKSQKEKNVQIPSGVSELTEAVTTLEDTINTSNTVLNSEESSYFLVPVDVNDERDKPSIQEDTSYSTFTSEKLEKLLQFKHAKTYTDKIASCLSQYDSCNFSKKLEILTVLLQTWEQKENIVLCKEKNGILEVCVSDFNSTFSSESLSAEHLSDEVITVINKSYDVDANSCEPNTDINKELHGKNDCENFFANLQCDIENLGCETEISNCPEEVNHLSEVISQENQPLQELPLKQPCSIPASSQKNEENVITHNFLTDNIPTVFTNPQLQSTEAKTIVQPDNAPQVCKEKSQQNVIILPAGNNTAATLIILPANLQSTVASNSVQLNKLTEPRPQTLPVSAESPSKKHLFSKPKQMRQLSKPMQQKRVVKKTHKKGLFHLKDKINEFKNITLNKKLYNYKSCLTETDMEDITANRMLNDKIINVGQILINLKFPNASGLQDVLLGSALEFKVITSQFVQIIHCGNFPHWITVSTLGAPPTVVYVYDSLNECIPRDAVPQICNIMNIQASQLCVITRSMQMQSNSVDCGLFALASAMTLLSGDDPSDIVYDTSKMREHLLTALRMNSLSQFPTVSDHDTPMTLGRIESFTLHCLCRQPLLTNVSFQNLKKFYQCKFCEKWYHKHCKESCCGTNVLRVSISGVDIS